MAQGEKHIMTAIADCRKPFSQILTQSVQKNSGQGPGSKVTSKVTSVYTCCILLHSPAGQAITKKLKSSKKVCQLIASSNL